MKTVAAVIALLVAVVLGVIVGASALPVEWGWGGIGAAAFLAVFVVVVGFQLTARAKSRFLAFAVTSTLLLTAAVVAAVALGVAPKQRMAGTTLAVLDRVAGDVPSLTPALASAAGATDAATPAAAIGDGAASRLGAIKVPGRDIPSGPMKDVTAANRPYSQSMQGSSLVPTPPPFVRTLGTPPLSGVVLEDRTLLCAMRGCSLVMSFDGAYVYVKHVGGYDVFDARTGKHLAAQELGHATGVVSPMRNAILLHKQEKGTWTMKRYVGASSKPDVELSLPVDDKRKLFVTVSADLKTVGLHDRKTIRVVDVDTGRVIQEEPAPGDARLVGRAIVLFEAGDQHKPTRITLVAPDGSRREVGMMAVVGEYSPDGTRMVGSPSSGDPKQPRAPLALYSVPDFELVSTLPAGGKQFTPDGCCILNVENDLAGNVTLTFIDAKNGAILGSTRIKVRDSVEIVAPSVADGAHRGAQLSAAFVDEKNALNHSLSVIGTSLDGKTFFVFDLPSSITRVYDRAGKLLGEEPGQPWALRDLSIAGATIAYQPVTTSKERLERREATAPQ